MKELITELKKGRTFSQYNNVNRFLWDDTKEVINANSVSALVRRGLLKYSDIVIKES